MSKTEKIYKQVTAAKAKDPTAKVSEICRRLKLGKNGQTLYYNARRAVQAKAPKQKPKPRAGGYQRLKAVASPAADTAGRLVCVVGSPEQVRAFMGGAL